MTEVTQADRDAAADIWRDYVAKPGECIVERQMRSGEMDGVGSMVQSFARHRKQAAAEERAKIVAWLRGLHWTHAGKLEADRFATAISNMEPGK